MLTLFRERYEVLATVGSGGEAQIVKALDRQHGRFVALKIRPVRDQAAREDLLGEARLLLALPPHPALPLVREDFFDHDDYVVAMDWVEGTDLATLLAENGRPGLASSSVLAYLAQAAEALTHLHSQSPPVIHGDVKPGNLILTKGGRIKLVDFGLSSAPNVPRVRAGTPGYRAPELAAGGVPSRASDVYALAATAFALLTGSAPAGVLPVWDGFDPAQAKQLEAAIRLGMATDPSRRPKTPGELVERLRAGWSAALPTGVVTFCWSDIEGSAALWESHPEAMAEALVRHDELIADAVEARGGSLIKSMGEGDSTVSVFDSAPAAVAAALAANRSLAAEEWPPGIRIAARWGIHTGEAERRDADYYGPSVNLAARVRAQADGGEILLSSVTSELVAAHLPDDCSLVDLGSHRLEGVGTPERIHALAGPGVRTPLSAGECPYRGLLSFEAGDERFFFGREAVVADLVARVASGELLAVVGASGSGKSSVLRAGLVAAARAGRIAGIDHAVVVTPGAEAVLDVPDRPETLLVVDQFEELFVLCDDAARRAAFVDALLGRRGRVAIGLRADVYGRLGAHAALAAAVAANQVLLGAMTDDELARAVAEPARLAALRLEPGLVELIRRDVAAEPGALPLLSHALRATWERRDGRTLTVEGYRASGGVTSAIARTADAVIDVLPADGRALARSVFLRMTELGEGTIDSRRRVASDELVPAGTTSPDAVNALLERLAEARLVTLSDGSAEVAHEALIREWPRLRRWLEEDRAGIRAHRQLGDAARLWDAGGRETSDLYRGARLAGAVELAEGGRAELNATERAFLDAGVTEDQRERRAERRTNRRLRGLLAGAAVFLVLAVGAGILSVNQRNRAEAQALRSDAERVGALAQTAQDLGQSMLYGVAAVELEDRVQTRGQLLAVLQRNPGLLLTRRLSAVEVAAAAISPDGRLLASGDRDGVVRFTDLRTWKPSGPSLRLGRPVLEQAMKFAPDGRTVAVGSGRGKRTDVHFVDVAARQARRVRSWRGPVTELDVQSLLLAYAPDGRHLAVALALYDDFGTVTAQRLALLDARRRRTVWERALATPEGVWEAHVGFTPDGALISSAAPGGTIVWDARRGRILRRYPIGGRFAISPDGERVAIALNSAFAGDPHTAVAVLNLRTGKSRTLADNLPNTMSDGLAFNRDGTRIIGGTYEGTHVWDVKTGSIVETFNAPRRRIRHGVVLDPQGRALLGTSDGIVSLWDPDGGRRLGRRFFWGPIDSGCAANPCSVIDPRGALMATSQGDGTTALVDLRTKRLHRMLPARDGDVAGGLSFSSDGRRLATGGTAGSVTIWDPATGAVVDRLRYADPVSWTAISPDGRLLAAQRQAPGAADSFVDVRELPSGRPLFSHRVRSGAGGLQFSHDSRVLFALGCCERGSTVIAWDARSGAARFQRHPSAEARTFALAPDSRTLLVGTGEGSVLTLDARTGREREPAIDVASADMAQVAVSPDGRLLAASDWNAEATLWDLRTHERVGDPFAKIPGWVPQVAFEPNGRLLLTEGGSASEWPVDRPTLQRFACRVAGRSLSRDEWRAVLPNQPYRRVCR